MAIPIHFRPSRRHLFRSFQLIFSRAFYLFSLLLDEFLFLQVELIWRKGPAFSPDGGIHFLGAAADEGVVTTCLQVYPSLRYDFGTIVVNLGPERAFLHLLVGLLSVLCLLLAAEPLRLLFRPLLTSLLEIPMNTPQFLLRMLRPTVP